MISYYIEKDGCKTGQGLCQKELLDTIPLEGGVLNLGEPPAHLKWPEVTKTYAMIRRDEYPPLSDLADALYWQSKGDNSKMADYLSAVDKIKTKYPKPQDNK